MKSNVIRTADVAGFMAQMGADREKVLVAFSGGADSTALLCLMWDISKNNPTRVYAMHVNHGIRGAEADGDERFCREFCREHGIEFFSTFVDVPTASGGRCDELTARRLRYDALIKKAKELGCVLATAHTASDNAETVIFNVARGCGISGLGIPPTREYCGVKIIRPLIKYTRAQIEEYLGEKNIGFVNDTTNFDDKYTRNFIRHNVIPSLEGVNAQAVTNISELSARARADEDFIDKFASEYVSSHEDADIKSLSAQHEAVLMRILMKLISRYTDQAPSYERLLSLRDAIKAGTGGKITELSGKMCATVVDGKLRFIKLGEKTRPSATDFCFDAVGFDDFDGDLGFSVTTDEPKQTSGARVFKAEISKQSLEKLKVRRRRATDSYRFGKMTRTLKKLTSDVPFDARTRRPVFCVDDIPVWYPGFPAADGMGKEITVYYIEKIM